MDRLCRCSLAVQLFAAAYLCAVFDVLPVPQYYLALHTWSFETINDQPAIDLYGHTLWGLVAAVAGYLAGGLYTRLQRRLKFDLAVPSACVAILVFTACLVLHEAHEWL